MPSLHHVSLSEPVIVAISVAAGIVVFVAFIWILRWARRKPSTQLPPPRQSFLSPYAANRGGNGAGYRGTVYAEDESKLAYSSTPSFPYGSSGPPSDSSQLALWRGPDGEYYHDRGRDSFIKPVDSEAGSIIALTADQRLRHAPSAPSPLSGSPSLRPQSAYELSSSPSSSVVSPVTHAKDFSQSSSSEEAGRPDAQFPFPSELGVRPQTASESPTLASFASAPNMPRSRHSVATSMHQSYFGPMQPSNTMPSRRMSRQSVHSIAASTPEQRRLSVRGAPHKTNMQIVLPEPLAPIAARTSSVFGYASFPDGMEPSRSQSTSNRRSRVDLWTEANTSRMRTASEVDPSRIRRKSRESTESRSFDLLNHFQYMEPPPPLPSLSRSGTPNSFSSAHAELPPPLPSPTSTLADQSKPPPTPPAEQLVIIRNQDTQATKGSPVSAIAPSLEFTPEATSPRL